MFVKEAAAVSNTPEGKQRPLIAAGNMQKYVSGLRSMAEDAGKQFAAGVVLYAGERTVPFGANLWAVPISELWAE
jgi:uncharacterized protein